MLVLHSSSRCDVCLSEYSWETSSKSPHAIPCGHIFCRDCLYTNNPPLCPLCRKLYQPNKMKKLHVDKPDDIDDHKEVDLLQRLVISWDTPPEQLQEIVTEVDSWLESRADDSCIPLRKARAALERHRALKSMEIEMSNTVRTLEDEAERLNSHLSTEKAQIQFATEQHLTQIDELTRQILYLDSELRRLQQPTATRYTHNPLPPPPEPISTDYIPTFEQAMTESGASTRFSELPASPGSTRYPAFEVESRSHRKGKARSSDRRHVHDDPRYHPQPSPQPFSNHYVQPHLAPLPEQPLKSNRPVLHFAKTQQPLDIYTVINQVIHGTSQGLNDGYAMAMGGRLAETSADVYPSYQPQPSSSRHLIQPTTAFETTGSYPLNSDSIYQNLPYSAPITGERSARRRRTTMESSIISSASSHNDHRPSSRSRSRSQTRGSSYVTQDPSAALSNPAPESPSSRRSTGLVPAATFDTAPQTNSEQNSSSHASPNPSNTAANPPGSDRRYSPSVRSRYTLESGSWGTPAPSHLASGSLIEGLTSFRQGTDVVYERGPQEIMTFGLLGSDGHSIRTRQTSLSDLSAFNDAESRASPAREVNTMVGVVPDDGESFSRSGSQSNRNRDARVGQHRPATSLDARSHRSSSEWDRSNDYRSLNSISSGYMPDDDRSSHRANAHGNPTNGSAWPNRPIVEERTSSYRSPTAVDPRAHSSWADSRASGQDNAPSARQTSSREYDRRDAEAEQPGASSSGRHGLRRSARHSRASRTLPVESPAFPVTVEYTDDDQHSRQRRSPRPNVLTHLIEVPAFNGNALGLELTTESGISAPTPVFSAAPFLRSWSREHYES